MFILRFQQRNSSASSILVPVAEVYETTPTDARRRHGENVAKPSAAQNITGGLPWYTCINRFGGFAACGLPHSQLYILLNTPGPPGIDLRASPFHPIVFRNFGVDHTAPILIGPTLRGNFFVLSFFGSLMEYSNTPIRDRKNGNRAMIGRQVSSKFRP